MTFKTARYREHVIAFTDEEVRQLKRRMKSPKTNRTLRGRIGVLLLLDTNHSDPGLTYGAVATRSGTSLSTVRTVVRLYASRGLDEVLTLKRNTNSDAAKRKMDGRSEVKLLQIACGPLLKEGRDGPSVCSRTGAGLSLTSL